MNSILKTLHFHSDREKLVQLVKMAKLSKVILSSLCIGHACGENYSVLSCNTDSTVSIPFFMNHKFCIFVTNHFVKPEEEFLDGISYKVKKNLWKFCLLASQDKINFKSEYLMRLGWFTGYRFFLGNILGVPWSSGMDIRTVPK